MLRAALADINADKSITPEVRQTKGLGVQNQIDDLIGQQAAKQVQDQAREEADAREAKVRLAEGQEKLNVALDKGAEITADNADKLRLATIAADEQSGAISKLSADQQIAAIHTEQHTDKLKALWNTLQDLKDAAKDLKPGSPEAADNSAKQVGLLNQISQEQTAGSVQAGKDTSTIAADLAKPYLTAADQVQSGWLSAQRSILTGQKTLGAAMKQMWSEIALNSIGNIEKIGFQFAKQEIMMVAHHAASTQAQTGIDAAGAASSTAISKTASTEEGLDAAKVAFKNTYKVVSGWPVVGPILAPVLAAGAFTAVAAFEEGTMMVPRVGMAVLHPGEAVLNNPNASVLRDALAGRGPSGGSGDLHLHLGGNTFNGSDSRSMNGDIDDHVHASIKRLHRNGKLNFTKAA